jgi:RES domain-containing protein
MERTAPLPVYRLARARYANLSGIGAANQPGRWNRKDQEAIYTSTEMGVPLLERLVHTQKDLIPSNLAMLTLHLSGRWVAKPGREAVLTDMDTDASMVVYASIERARMAMQDPMFGLKTGFEPMAIAVPSVIVPVWNLVLYPEAPGFWQHISLVSVEPFGFDPRLFPEQTPVEQ